MNTETKKKNFMSGKHWIIVIIIIVAGYSTFNGITGLRKSKVNEDNWTPNDYKTLVNNCIKDAGNNGIIFPELTKSYCECSNDKIMAKFSKQQYLEIIKKDIEEQKEILLPVFQDCLTEYTKAINQTGK